MGKVKITSKGIPHFYAVCHKCDWSYGDHRNRKKGFAEIKKHVRETRHEVYLEEGVATRYTFVEAVEQTLAPDKGQAAA